MIKEIRSDYLHAWKLFKSVLFLPFILFLALLRRRSIAQVFKPVFILWKYFWEARFTAWLIVVNIVMFVGLRVYFVFLPTEGQEAVLMHYFFDGPSNLIGLKIIPFVLNWFVHLSFSHLLGNMIGLLILGRVVEKNFSGGKFALIYFGSAVISGLVDDLVHIGDMSYFANGASGAIAGLAAVAMLVNPFYLVFIFIVPIPVMIFGWLQLYTDISGVLNPSASVGVANFAHLGGFFAIAILAFFMSSQEKSKLWKGIIINIGTLLVLSVLWFFLH